MSNILLCLFLGWWWTADPTDQESVRFGGAVSTGDFNNDGYADAIIGAPVWDHGNGEKGRVYIYYGSSAGLPDSAAWIGNPTYQDTGSSPKHGYRISSGDFNNDGYDDPIIGVPYWDGQKRDEGRVYVYFMAPYIEETQSQTGGRLKIYPNPFIQRTVIRCWGLGVSEKREAEIKIYDIGGRVICTLPIPNHNSMGW